MSTDYEKILNALPRPDLYDSWELVKRHMPVEQPPSAASYIVFQKGGQCYAKNGTTGHIEFGPGDASTVIQSTINSITKGKIVIKDDVTFTSQVNMKNDVAIESQGEVTISTDIYGFVFDGVQGASLIGGKITVNAATYTKASIKFTGNGCIKNRVSNVQINLPSGQGYGLHFVAGTNQAIYGNELEDIKIYRGKRGILVELSGNGWMNVNKFENVWIWNPSEYGFSVVNNGLDYAGNYHAFVWVEIGTQNNVSAFHFLLTGNSINDNMFIACNGVDFGGTNSYFAVRDSASTKKTTNNTFIGCQGSNYMPSTGDFPTDIWIDYGNWTTPLYYDASILTQRLKPSKANTDMLLQLWSSKTLAGRAALNFQNTNVDSKEYMELGCYGTEFNLQLARSSAGTQRPFIFKMYDGTSWSEIARIDIDKNFKFSNLKIPTSAPATPVAGSMYFDTSTNKLYVHNGTSWVAVTLA